MYCPPVPRDFVTHARYACAFVSSGSFGSFAELSAKRGSADWSSAEATTVPREYATPTREKHQRNGACSTTGTYHISSPILKNTAASSTDNNPPLPASSPHLRPVFASGPVARPSPRSEQASSPRLRPNPLPLAPRFSRPPGLARPRASASCPVVRDLLRPRCLLVFSSRPAIVLCFVFVFVSVVLCVRCWLFDSQLVTWYS